MKRLIGVIALVVCLTGCQGTVCKGWFSGLVCSNCRRASRTIADMNRRLVSLLARLAALGLFLTVGVSCGGW